MRLCYRTVKRRLSRKDFGIILQKPVEASRGRKAFNNNNNNMWCDDIPIYLLSDILKEKRREAHERLKKKKKMREKPLPHVCIRQTRKWDFPVISPFILRGWQFSTNLMAQRAEPLARLVPLPNVIRRQEQRRGGCSCLSRSISVLSHGP